MFTLGDDKKDNQQIDWSWIITPLMGFSMFHGRSEQGIQIAKQHSELAQMRDESGCSYGL